MRKGENRKSFPLDSLPVITGEGVTQKDQWCPRQAFTALWGRSWTAPTSTCSCLSVWTTMMWLCRTWLNTFLTHLMRRGSMLRNRWSCRANEMAESSFRIEVRLWGPRGWLNTMEDAVHLGNSVSWSRLEMRRLALDTNNPYVWFHWDLISMSRFRNPSNNWVTT